MKFDEIKNEKKSQDNYVSIIENDTEQVIKTHNEHHSNNTESKTTLQQVMSLISFAITTLMIVIPIRVFILKPFIVEGQSMYPRFATYDYLIIDRLSYRFHKPERGDVITFKYPKNPKRYFLKRIIGLPGETVILKGRTTIIKNNNTGKEIRLNEPYIDSKKRKTDRFSVTLEDGEYFVMGDNRKESLDSRYFGPIKRKAIVGRVAVQLFPFTEISWLPGKAVYSDK